MLGVGDAGQSALGKCMSPEKQHLFIYLFLYSVIVYAKKSRPRMKN